MKKLLLMMSMIGIALVSCNNGNFDDPEDPNNSTSQQDPTGLPEPAANEIYYTTASGLLLDLEKESWYKTSVIDHSVKDNTICVLTFAASIKAIVEEQFQDQDDLLSVRLPHGITKIAKKAFYGCSNLQQISIPNSVTEIGYSAFSGCSSLQTISIPNSVTEIGSYAFSGCSSLQNISIPNSVTVIGYHAFGNCQNLKSFYCKPTTPPYTYSYSNTGIFDSYHHGYYEFTAHESLVIYVPTEAVETYKSASGWRYYKDRIQGYDFSADNK